MNNQVTITQVNEMLEKCRKYFKAKLLEGEFEIINQEFYSISIKVEEHVFSIWTQNTPKSRKQYMTQGFKTQTIDLQITDEEAVILDGILQPIIKQYIQDVEIKQLEERLSELKKVK